MLTKEQQNIVEHVGTPLCVLAGPGTGKTFCIAQRILHQINKHKIAPKNIYAITFTKKATRQMQTRLEEIGVPPNRIPVVGTLHSLAMKILRANHGKAGVPLRFNVIGNAEERVILKDVQEELRAQGIIIPFKGFPKIDNYLQAYKANISGACAPLWLSNNSSYQRISVNFTKRYEDMLKFYNAIDWSDVIGRVINLIKQDDDVRGKLHGKIHSLLVDEYQDLNPSEQIFVDLLVAEPAMLCIVGDDDQSIYESFRFADPGGILNFQGKYKNGVTLYITRCRRCPPEIIEKALLLIKNNKRRMDKELQPHDPQKKGNIATFSHHSKIAEIAWLTEKIQAMIKNGVKSENIMVLFQEGKIAGDYIKAMQDANIPLNIQLRVVDMFSTGCFSQYYATLQFIVDQNNNIALRQCLDYWRDIGSKTIRQLRKIAETKDQSIWGAVQDVAKYPDAFKQIMHRRSVAELCTYLSGLLVSSKFKITLDAIRQHIKGCEHDAGVNKIYTYLMQYDGKEQVMSLKEALNNFEQAIDSGEFEEDDSQTSGAKIMTMHSAKGLEADHVFLPALEDDIIPGQTENAEERRRLFYVSVTRARINVFLSWAAQRIGQEVHMPGRRMVGKKKSQFLVEMGE